MVDYESARVTMVDTQVRPSDVTRLPVIAAMMDVPREIFVPTTSRAVAYAGENVPLFPGRVLLEPRTIAKILDALAIQPRELVLDVGCGTGYVAAVVGQIAGGVVALEDDAAQTTAASAALSAAGVDNVAVVTGRLAAGWPGQGPYDVIIISGGAVEEVSAALTDQLADGGRIAALFVDGALGTVRLGVAIAGQVSWRNLFNAHAPLLTDFVRPRVFSL